jgi:hypothetical protein
MGVSTNSVKEFRQRSSGLSSPSAVLFQKAEYFASAPRRVALARAPASACQKEFALEQALRKAETPERPFIGDG